MIVADNILRGMSVITETEPDPDVNVPGCNFTSDPMNQSGVLVWVVTVALEALKVIKQNISEKYTAQEYLDITIDEEEALDVLVETLMLPIWSVMYASYDATGELAEPIHESVDCNAAIALPDAIDIDGVSVNLDDVLSTPPFVDFVFQQTVEFARHAMGDIMEKDEWHEVAGHCVLNAIGGLVTFGVKLGIKIVSGRSTVQKES